MVKLTDLNNWPSPVERFAKLDETMRLSAGMLLTWDFAAEEPPDLFDLAESILGAHGARYGLEQAYNLLVCAANVKYRENNPTEESPLTFASLRQLDQQRWEDAQRRWKGIIADLRGDALGEVQ